MKGKKAAHGEGKPVTAYRAGKNAFAAAATFAECPFADVLRADDWRMGWAQAAAAYRVGFTPQDVESGRAAWAEHEREGAREQQQARAATGDGASYLTGQNHSLAGS